MSTYAATSGAGSSSATSWHSALQEAGIIPVLLECLRQPRQRSPTLQLQALQAVANLCRLHPARQEAAAVAGLVPLLLDTINNNPAQAFPAGQAGLGGRGKAGQEGVSAAAAEAANAAALRPLSVQLLCWLAHATQRARAEMWAQHAEETLLLLLREPVRCLAGCHAYSGPLLAGYCANPKQQQGALKHADNTFMFKVCLLGLSSMACDRLAWQDALCPNSLCV